MHCGLFEWLLSFSSRKTSFLTPQVPQPWSDLLMARRKVFSAQQRHFKSIRCVTAVLRVSFTPAQGPGSGVFSIPQPRNSVGISYSLCLLLFSVKGSHWLKGLFLFLQTISPLQSSPLPSVHCISQQTWVAKLLFYTQR